MAVPIVIAAIAKLSEKTEKSDNSESKSSNIPEKIGSDADLSKAIPDKLDMSLENNTAELSSSIPDKLDTQSYYDDKGNLYRVGNELLPNNEYEINGYKYTTDDRGRIIKAEGKLHLKNHDGKLPIKDSIEDISKGDHKSTDDRGHIIADQFGGSNGLENMIPQDASINRGAYKTFEQELAQEVKSGKNVSVNIEPVYDGDSHRPSALAVTYGVDGKESVRIFPNEKEG